MDAERESRPDDAGESWSVLNQRWMIGELARLRARMDTYAKRAVEAPEDPPAAVGGTGFVPALERCAAHFGLSAFERDVLLLAAGVELDHALRQSVTRAHGRTVAGSRLAQPTFSLAFATLAQPHWDALSPQAPLRRWKLLELDGRRSPALQPLYVDERILHFLTGVASSDDRLSGLMRFAPAAAEVEITPFARHVARRLAATDDRPALVVLMEERHDMEALRAAASETLAALECPGLWLTAHDLPPGAAELAETAMRVDREAVLTDGLAVIELDPHAENAGEQAQRCVTLLSHLLGPALLLGACDPVRLARLHRRVARVAVPPADERAAGTAVPSGERGAALARAMRPALRQFHLPAGALRSVVEQVTTEAPEDGDEPPGELERRVWATCRNAARGGLDALAQRVESRATFDDLVLPAAQKQLLREVAEHLRHRDTVYGEWGMGDRSARGEGLCVLFAGESGTGKTLAAEVIANEALLDLYRVDLATVVSKYIGETEKNLQRVFDAAESSGAVLLFDEADALFGKRSDVKDSHDRYANIEVAYLLQRVETYRGLAILTTNFRSALDRAFLRRIRFVVQFPFPDEAARERIWRRELPETAPREDVDFTALARMQLSGGHIRSVALNAAFAAAGAGEGITMAHLRRAAQREAAKLERPLTESSGRARA
jgi:AAA+ superfamily predicted ATPase